VSCSCAAAAGEARDCYLRGVSAALCEDDERELELDRNVCGCDCHEPRAVWLQQQVDQQRDLLQEYIGRCARLGAVQLAARDLVDAVDAGLAQHPLVASALVAQLRSALEAVSSSSPSPGGAAPSAA